MVRTSCLAAVLMLVALPAVAQPASAPAVTSEERGSAAPIRIVRGIDAPISELLINPRTRAVLERELPELAAPTLRDRSLRYLAARAPDLFPAEKLRSLDAQTMDAPLSRLTPQARATLERDLPNVTGLTQLEVSLRELARRAPERLSQERLHALDAELSAALRDTRSTDAQTPRN